MKDIVTEELQRLASYFDFAEFGVGVLKVESDTSRRYVYCSRSFDSILGVKEGQALGQKCSDFTGALTNKETLNELRLAVKSSEFAFNDILEYDDSGDVILTRNIFLPLQSHNNRYAVHIVDKVSLKKSILEKDKVQSVTAEELKSKFQEKIDWLTKKSIYDLIETRDTKQYTSEEDDIDEVRFAFDVIDSFRKQIHRL